MVQTVPGGPCRSVPASWPSPRLSSLKGRKTMKQTITRLAEHIIGVAGELGIEVEALDGDPGIAGAESVLHLRDAQHALNRADDAVTLAISQRAESVLSSDGKAEPRKHGRRTAKKSHLERGPMARLTKAN